MATYGHTFTSGDTVTPTKLNNARTVSDIVNADISATAAIAATKLASDSITNTQIKSDAAIALSKLATGALPSAITVASANLTYDNGPTGGFRNRIINGNFDIWQRGTSSSSSGFVAADRWTNLVNGSSSTQSRQAFTLGQTDVPNEPTYFCRMAVTSSAGNGHYVILTQPIEDVRALAGQSVTVSFYAKADASKTIALELRHDFGSGGSPSVAVNAIGAQKFNLTTSWQKFTATISVPSISGKTLGSNNNSKLDFAIWLDAGSDFNSRTASLGQQSGTFDIAQVQVEQGSKATPFEARPIGTELALCYRYYQTVSLASAGYVQANALEYRVPLPTPMRATPTVVVGATINTNTTGATINAVGNAHVNLTAVGVGGGGYYTAANAALSAEL